MEHALTQNRVKLWPRSLFLLFSLLPLQAALAQESSMQSTIGSIYQFIQADNYEQAFELAQRYEDEYEGELEFDLAYGLAAHATDHCDAATFPLERVLQNNADQHNARFALAICYYKLGNRQAAKQELQLILQSPTTTATQNAAQEALNAIQRADETRADGWSNNLEAGLGFDSNPNNGVENEVIDIPVLGEVRLFDQSVESSSAYYDVSANFNYLSSLDQNTNWRVSFGLSSTDFSDSVAQSRTNLQASAGYQSNIADIDWSVSAFVRPLWLEGEQFLNYFGTKAQGQKQLSSAIDAGVALTLAKVDYEQLDALSRNQIHLAAWIETPTLGGLSRLGVKLGQENSIENQYDFSSRSVQGFSYQYSKQLSWRWASRVSVDYLQADFDSVHPLFQQTRKDDLIQIKGQLYYQWLQDWILSAQASWVSNDSNISLYEYKRSNLWLGARYQF